MTHAPRCVCDACWPTRLAEMSALVAGAARRLGAELLARVAHARPARVPAMSSRVRRREDIARTNLSGPPSRPQGRRPFHGDSPAAAVPTALADRGPGRLPPSGIPESPPLVTSARRPSVRAEYRPSDTVRARIAAELAARRAPPPEMAAATEPPAPPTPTDLASLTGSRWELQRAADLDD